MTNGHVFYHPISKIDQFPHLKDGRWVMLIFKSGNPFIGRWVGDGWEDDNGTTYYEKFLNGFSTLDPRPIGPHVVVDVIFWKSGSWVETKGLEKIDDVSIQDGTVTVRIPIQEPLKLEVTAG